MLNAFGQSPWLDFIHRGHVRSGGLQDLVENDGICGVTSNPTIFEIALRESDVYDSEIAELSRNGLTAPQIYEQLVLEDVREAADCLRSVYDESDGTDGYVSLEVSPHLAQRTDATVAEASRLWRAIGRPNAMIKVPATAAGLPAIRRLLADRVNVNATLLFGLPVYRELTEQVLLGLADAAAAGRPIDRIACVSSFFLSRIDTAVDPILRRSGHQHGSRAQRAAGLEGHLAIASARCAYEIFEETLRSERWQKLAAAEAMPPRLLWASTRSKHPAQSDVKYVEPLIGPLTVTTLTLATLDAYRDHGRPAVRLAEQRRESQWVLESAASLGIEMDVVTHELLVQGVAKFIGAFDRSIAGLEAKRRTFCGGWAARVPPT